MLALLSGCLAPMTEENVLSSEWTGRKVGDFITTHQMDSSAEVVDKPAGIPIGIKGKIGEDRVVTVFFVNQSDLTGERDWKVSDFSDQDISGIQIMLKW